MSAQSRCRTRGITRSFTRHLERSDIVMLRARADFMSAPRYDVTSPHPPRSRARRRARRPCSRRLFLRTGSPAVTATPTTTAAMESWFSAMTFELSDRFETHADAKAKPAGQGAEGPGRRKVRLWREHGRGPLARELFSGNIDEQRIRPALASMPRAVLDRRGIADIRSRKLPKGRAEKPSSPESVSRVVAPWDHPSSTGRASRPAQRLTVAPRSDLTSVGCARRRCAGSACTTVPCAQVAVTLVSHRMQQHARTVSANPRAPGTC